MIQSPTEWPAKGVVVLYDGDPDGLTAAFAAWLRFGDEARYIAVARNEVPPPLPGCVALYICDFNYPREQMLALAQQVPFIQLLDHHKTAQDELGDLSFCYFDTTRSAAGIAWEYFQGTPPPAFVGYVQDADLWTWALPCSHEVHMAVDSHPLEFQKWQEISGVTIPRDPHRESACLENLMDDGETCLRFAHAKVNEILDNCRMATFICNGSNTITFDPDAPTTGDGVYCVPVVNTPLMRSHVCHQLLNDYPNSPFSAAYCDMPGGVRDWSLRSRADFDVSAVAKKFGGGGHRMASGFKVASNG